MGYRIRDLQRAQQRPDTAVDIADRKRRYAVMEQVREEQCARFPVITADNIDAALQFQEERYRELYDRKQDGRSPHAAPAFDEHPLEGAGTHHENHTLR